MANIHHIHHTFGLGCAMPPHLAAPHLTDPTPMAYARARGLGASLS